MPDFFAIYIELTGYQGWMGCVASFFVREARASHTRPERQKLLADLTRFAEDLGAITFQVSSNDIVRTLIAEASVRHITQLVLGLPARSRWEELLSGSVINRVLRLTQEMRVHLVPYKKE